MLRREDELEAPLPRIKVGTRFLRCVDRVIIQHNEDPTFISIRRINHPEKVGEV